MAIDQKRYQKACVNLKRMLDIAPDTNPPPALIKYLCYSVLFSEAGGFFKAALKLLVYVFKFYGWCSLVTGVFIKNKLKEI